MILILLAAGRSRALGNESTLLVLYFFDLIRNAYNPNLFKFS